MSMTLKARFAPSPTGLMHFGNLRTALFNYLFARRNQGIFLLRVEDTDTGRSEAHFGEAILNDLRWLGLEWQEGPYYQSERQAIYDEYYQRLERKGCVYPCFCTEEQLAIARKVQLASHQPPRYPGTCRHLTEADIRSKRALGLPFTLRFRIPDGTVIEFEDLVKGRQRFLAEHIGDFIIRRGDGSASFMFCNVIDDVLMGVTHALRGDDHLTNTPRQLLILQALDLPLPSYGHFPTILGPDSRPLSKRNGSRSIQELRQEGYLPLGILNYLARLGHHDPDPNLLSLEKLEHHFNLTHISHSPAHYDPSQLQFWQKAAMHACTWQACWQQIAPYVNEWVPENVKEAFVETIQPNLVMSRDALPWAKVIFGEIEISNPDALKTLQEAGPHLLKIAFDFIASKTTIDYSALLSELQQKTGRKGKAIFAPLRAALTGELHGPELAKILLLMGTKKARERLEKAAEYATRL